VSLILGTYQYALDIQGANTFQVTPTAVVAGANILVNNDWVASGNTTPHRLAGDMFHIIVQDGNRAPTIYAITLTGRADISSSADLAEISVLHGLTPATPVTGNVFTTTIPNSASAFRVRAVPLYAGAEVRIGNERLLLTQDWLGNTIIPIDAGQTEVISHPCNCGRRCNAKDLYPASHKRRSARYYTGGFHAHRGNCYIYSCLDIANNTCHSRWHKCYGSLSMT